jgi:hypothetical protein
VTCYREWAAAGCGCRLVGLPSPFPLSPLPLPPSPIPFRSPHTKAADPKPSAKQALLMMPYMPG